MTFGLNGGFLKRKHVIFAKWGFCKKKTRDFRVKLGICKKKMRDFRVKWGICEEKARDFCLNAVFAKRKRVIFAYMGDLQVEKA